MLMPAQRISHDRARGGQDDDADLGGGLSALVATPTPTARGGVGKGAQRPGVMTAMDVLTSSGQVARPGLRAGWTGPIPGGGGV